MTYRAFWRQIRKLLPDLKGLWRICVLIALLVLMGVALIFHDALSRTRHTALVVVACAYLIGPYLSFVFLPWIRRLIHSEKRTGKSKDFSLKILINPLLWLIAPAMVLLLIWTVVGALALAIRKGIFTFELAYKDPTLIPWLLLIPAGVAYMVIGSGGTVFGAWLALGTSILAGMLAFSALRLEGKVLGLFGTNKDFSPSTVLAAGFVFAISSGAIHYAIWKTWPSEYSGIHMWLDTFYFSVVTMATVGYGDVVPIGQLAKWTTLAQIVVSVMILAIAVSAAMSAWIMNHQPEIVNMERKEDVGKRSDPEDGSEP